MMALFLGLFWIAVTHEPHYLVTQNGMSNLVINTENWGLGAFFCYIVIAFLSIFSVSGTIASEVENGMLAAVVPRPVYRAEIVLGKWLGYALAEAAYVTVLFMGIVAISGSFEGVIPTWPTLILAWMLFVGQAWVLLAVGLLGSIVLPTLANGVTLGLLFVIAFLSGGVAQLPVSPLFTHIALGISLLLPTDGLYRRAVYELMRASAGGLGSALLGPFGARHVPSNMFLVYAALYLVGVLWLAVRLFNQKNI